PRPPPPLPSSPTRRSSDLADPSEAMIDRYLDAGDMYVIFAHGRAVAEAVITRREDGCELKNLATEKDARGKGYATRLLLHLFHLDRKSTRLNSSHVSISYA